MRLKISEYKPEVMQAYINNFPVSVRGFSLPSVPYNYSRQIFINQKYHYTAQTKASIDLKFTKFLCD